MMIFKYLLCFCFFSAGFGGGKNGNATIDDILEALEKVQLDVRDLKMENNDRKMEIALLQDTDFKLEMTTNDLKTITDGLEIKTAELLTNHEEDVIVLTERMDKLHLSPVGSIVAWVPRPESDSQTDQHLPDGWVRCDGSVIPEPSIWAGSHTPDLNTERRFLRGAADDSQVLHLENDQIQGNIF